jgi:hypothetical protein
LVTAASTVLLQSLTTFGYGLREKDAFHELDNPRIEELVDEFFEG